jgi:hypothetical protein
MSNDETIRFVRLSACIEAGLPISHAHRLNGSNADDINADAKAFAKSVAESRQATPESLAFNERVRQAVESDAAVLEQFGLNGGNQ